MSTLVQQHYIVKTATKLRIKTFYSDISFTHMQNDKRRILAIQLFCLGLLNAKYER